MPLTRSLALASLVAIFTACPAEETPPAPSAVVIVTLTPKTLSNDGSGQSTIDIDAKNADGTPMTGSATIELSPAVGSLDNATVTLTGGKGTAKLTACAGCDAGTRVTVKVTVGATQGQGSITFTSAAVSEPEIACDNNKDDNGNGAADCGDSNCLYRACSLPAKECKSGACTCQAGGCECLLGEVSEVTCADGKDNDCDGRVDCFDPDCEGRTCGTNLACSRGLCSTTGGGGTVVGDTSMDMTANPAKIPADGQSRSLVTAIIRVGGSPANNKSVRFVATFAGAGYDGLSDARSDILVNTNAAGEAQVFVKAPTRTGAVKITASVAASAGTATRELNVEVIRLGSISFDGAQFNVMGVRTSGFNEQNVLTFSLKDDAGLPFPDGVTVRFSATELAGAYVSPSEAKTAAGIVKTSLYPGTAAGTVSVVATATVGGLSITTPSDSIAIIGAKASGRNFSVQCGPNNIPGFVEHDCSFSWVQATSICNITLGDRFNNNFARGGEVFFTPEAGLMGASSQTAAFSGQGDPTSPGLGRTTMQLSAGGARLPRDVAAVAGEGTRALTGDICGRTTANQRDGLVTILAHTQGEEGFIDVNNNGQYDAGTEFFYDLTEPYVDADDDNVWDADEVFVDANNNGVFDGANGRWDADATIWAETRVIYTGRPFSMRTSPVALTQSRKSTQFAAIMFQDIYKNLLPPVTTYDTAVFGCDFLGAETSFQGAFGPSDYAYGFDYKQPTTCSPSTKICTVRSAFQFHAANDGDWSGPAVVLKSDAATDLPVPSFCSVSTVVTISGNGADRVELWGNTGTITGP